MPSEPHGTSLYLGELPPDLATVERMVHGRIRRTGKPLLFFDDFCNSVNNLRGLAKEAEAGTLNAGRTRLLAVSRHTNLTPDFDGYVRYLRTQGPLHDAERNPKYGRNARFDERGLIDSVLVVAPRGWGKSELLKAIIRHDVQAPNDTRPRGSVVILDPGNNLARQVARWPELVASDRLVYIEPGLRDGLTVGINPLDGTGLSASGRNEAATMLAEALDANSAPLSMNMETLVIRCAEVLMSIPGTTLRDFQTMLRDPDTDPAAAALLALARAYPDQDVRAFFEFDFESEGTKGSRVWLTARLQRLMADYHIAAMFGGTATVDLRAAIEARKVVVVNLGPMKAETTIGRAGRLLAAAIGGILRARDAEADPAPVLLVIDEVTMVAGGKLAGMIAQLRKYGLNMVLGQQVMGAGFSPEDKATILQNTVGRFIGGTNRHLIRDMLALTRDEADLPPIQHYQFWSQWRGDGPNLLKVRDDLVGHKLAAEPRAWAALVDRVTDPKRGYYRPDKPLHDPIPTRAPAASPAAPAEDAGAVGPPPPKPRRGAKAKPVDLVAKPGDGPKVRARTPRKPLADAGKPPEVKKTRRKLDD